MLIVAISRFVHIHQNIDLGEKQNSHVGSRIEASVIKPSIGQNEEMYI